MHNPLINVLVRTSNRPNYFARCYKSIREQTHKNSHIIVSYDDEPTKQYVADYPIDVTLDFKRVKDWNTVSNESFLPGYIEKPFPPNIYLNRMIESALPGYIVFLDDDNCFTSPDSLEKIASKITSENQMLLWKVQFPGYTVPNNHYFGQLPQCCQIDTGGFAFHTNYARHAVWDGYNYSDYRTALNLFMHIPRKEFVNEVLTGLQNVPGKGLRKDLPTQKISKQ